MATKLNYEFTEGSGGGNRPSWLLMLNGGICKGYNKEAFSKQAALEHAEAIVKNDAEVFGQKNVVFINSIKDDINPDNLTRAHALIFAKHLSKSEGRPAHIIDVHGEGLRVVSSDFSLDRQYFHSSAGQKMFFSLVETIKL